MVWTAKYYGQIVLVSSTTLTVLHCITHVVGEADHVVSFHYGEMSSSFLSVINPKNHKFKSYPLLGHSSCPQVSLSLSLEVHMLHQACPKSAIFCYLSSGIMYWGLRSKGTVQLVCMKKTFGLKCFAKKLKRYCAMAKKLNQAPIHYRIDVTMRLLKKLNFISW